MFSLPRIASPSNNHFTFHLGFVHPLKDVALRQCLPLSSGCCFPVPGGSLLSSSVVLPSSAWSSSWSLPTSLGVRVQVFVCLHFSVSASRQTAPHFTKKVMDQCVLPTMTYICQTWSLNKQLRNKLRIAQRPMEKKMLGLKQQGMIPCSEIMKRTKIIDILQYTLNQKRK